MVADYFFTFIIWIWQHSILAILPVEFTSFPLSTFQGNLDSISAFLSQSFSGINNIFPVYLLMSMTIVFVLAEIILFSVKGIMYLINLARGSGA
jgi:hypothetical protein